MNDVVKESLIFTILIVEAISLYLFRGIVSAGLKFVRCGLNRKSITLWLTGENRDQYLQYSLLVNETYQNLSAEIYFMDIIYVVISARMCVCINVCVIVPN